MAERDHSDDEDVVIDRVDDAVIPDVNSESGSSLESFGPWRPRVLPKKSNRPANAVTILVINSPQCTNCSRTQLDLVAHVQPKSAFT